jgi:hypothetical protein
MAKSRPPYSGESCASRMAARLALALDFVCRSAAHAFHTSRPWVTCVSIPLVLTWTSPAVAARVGLAGAGRSTLQNIQLPTGFRVRLLPSLLEYALHADIAVARTTCWFSNRYFTASSRSTMVMFSSLLWPTTECATLFTATCTCTNASGIVPATQAASASPRPEGNVPTCPSASHSQVTVAVGHVGDVARVVPRGQPGTLPPSLGCAGTAAS